MLLPRPNEILWFYMEGISDAVDVVEIADNLGGIVDGAIIQAMLSQSVQV